jgi:acetaldehyde dehydrogenase (acetylating)
MHAVKRRSGHGGMTELSAPHRARSKAPESAAIAPSAATKRLRVAILGSGIIGSDLLSKVLRSRTLTCAAFIGRTPQSPGLLRAHALGVATSHDGIKYLVNNPDCCDLVFDATSAADHTLHLPVLQSLGMISIDLTPAKLGRMCVPAVDASAHIDDSSVNMVTCGGQAAIPIAVAIAESQQDVSYIEVVSSVASVSAGPSTRLNLDEYILATEEGLRRYTGVKDCKTMLNLNPATPCIDMQLTIYATVTKPDLQKLDQMLQPLLARVTRYTPGYQITVGPVADEDRLIVTVQVRGVGDYLPAYAGNLDIINCAAVATAEKFAMQRNNAASDARSTHEENHH